MLSAPSSTLGDEFKQKLSKDGSDAGAQAPHDPGFTVYYLKGRPQADNVLDVIGKERLDLRKKAASASPNAGEAGLDQSSLPETAAAE